MLKDVDLNDVYFSLLSVAILFLLFVLIKRKPGLRRPFILITVVYNLVYLIWRTLFTLPLAYGVISVILGILLLLAEWMGFWQSFVFRFLFWKPYVRKLPEQSFQDKPYVDVFIATYNESVNILRKTVTACLNLNYPKNKLNIYLCDDGRRPEAEQLCRSLKIHYLSRNDNVDAKAGNINHALQVTNGEFILLLDADMVPKADFLEKTLDYFTDEKTGFVQTPQVFYNPDPFQFNLKANKSIPNEQDFFMQDIQGGRANYNAVLHVGTNAVFRRKAIDDIGGIPTGTITEDMATGMLIQAKGYKSVFVKEVLCTGLSVESFADLIKQRERWCRGNIQVTKKWNPLKLEGLSPAQRMIYIDGFFYWFSGVQKMIYIICPILYLLFGTVILDTSIWNLAVFWLPSFAASVLTFHALSEKSRTITWSHIYEAAMAPFLSLAALAEAILSRPIPFKVTPKGINSEKSAFSFQTALPHLALLAATVLGWLLTSWRLLNGPAVNGNSLAINLLWSLYNVAAIIISILVCVERPRKRVSERIRSDEKVTIDLDDGASCRIVDISEAGVKIECDNAAGNNMEGQNVDISVGSIGKLKGRVVWHKSGSGKGSFGVAFHMHSKKTYKKLLKYITEKDKGYRDN